MAVGNIHFCATFFRMETLPFITILLCITKFVQCARILSIAPALDINFKTQYLPLWRALADRGHNITLLTSVQMQPHENITQIDISKYCVFENILGYDDHPNRTPSMLDLLMNDKQMAKKLNDPAVKTLKTENFDLMFLDLALPYLSSLSEFYKCPLIGINDKDASPVPHYYLGNAIHPSIYPWDDRLFEDKGVFERSMAALQTLASFAAANLYLYKGSSLMFDFVNVELKDSLTVYGDMSLMIVNVNPIFYPLRPLVPTTINLGGFLSIAEPKKLPQDLQKYLDDAKDGCIYVSFGTTVNSEYLSKEQKDIFVNVFKSMAPMKVLWKFDDLNVAKDAKNVEVRNWVPQQDILRHPNVKLFITQGGLQSMEEAIDSAVPMLGMPFYGDQVNNVNKMHQKEFGVRLVPKEMDEKSLKSALEELLKNPKYKKTIDKLSAISKDQPMNGLEKAVWWTEYVLRHGTKHLRSPSADIPLYQYYFLDVIAFLIVAGWLMCYLIRALFKSTLSLIRTFYGYFTGAKEKKE